PERVGVADGGFRRGGRAGRGEPGRELAGLDQRRDERPGGRPTLDADLRGPAVVGVRVTGQPVVQRPQVVLAGDQLLLVAGPPAPGRARGRPPAAPAPAGAGRAGRPPAGARRRTPRPPPAAPGRAGPAGSR